MQQGGTEALPIGEMDLQSPGLHDHRLVTAGLGNQGKISDEFAATSVVMLRDDVGDGFPDPGYLSEPLLFDESLDRDGERPQAVSRARISFCAVWIPPRSAVRCAYSRNCFAISRAPALATAPPE
jgi:hypothetical protein